MMLWWRLVGVSGEEKRDSARPACTADDINYIINMTYMVTSQLSTTRPNSYTCCQ